MSVLEEEKIKNRFGDYYVTLRYFLRCIVSGSIKFVAVFLGIVNVCMYVFIFFHYKFYNKLFSQVKESTLYYNIFV